MLTSEALPENFIQRQRGLMGSIVSFCTHARVGLSTLPSWAGILSPRSPPTRNKHNAHNRRHYLISTWLPLPDTLTSAPPAPDLTRTWFPAESTATESVYSLPLIVTFDCCSFFGWQPARSKHKNKSFFMFRVTDKPTVSGSTSSEIYAIALLKATCRIKLTIPTGRFLCRRRAKLGSPNLPKRGIRIVVRNAEIEAKT